MNKSVHQISGGLAISLAIVSLGLVVTDLSKMPTKGITTTAEVPLIPGESEVTDLNVDGTRWVIVKLWNTDKTKGLEVYDSTVEPDVNLQVVKDRLKKTDVAGFIFIQQTKAGRQIYGYGAVTSSGKPSPIFSDYLIIHINQKWLDGNPILKEKLGRQTNN